MPLYLFAMWLTTWFPAPVREVVETAPVVYVFLDPECPICQSYTLTLRELHRQFAKQGVTFKAVYTSPGIEKKDIERFQKTYRLPIPYTIDRHYALAKRWNATTTPEVVVTSAIGAVYYQGAIDNWYYALGKNRPKPTERYLLDALTELTAGQPVSRKTTKAVGCLINY